MLIPVKDSSKIFALEAVSMVEVDEEALKINFTLNNNIVLVEKYDTLEEIEERLYVLFNYNYKLDFDDYNRALQLAKEIQGQQNQQNQQGQ